jgi:flagellar protein FliO/FliZ
MDLLDPARFAETVGALAVGLGLLAALAVGLRLWRQRAGAMPSRRLALVETLALDGRHRLVRVRDGEREHLLVLGPAAPLALTGGEPAATRTAGETA